MPENNEGQGRASLCLGCWFWQENSCALPNPVNGECVNYRPAKLQKSIKKPLIRPSIAAIAKPFSETTPEANFSLVDLADVRSTQATPTSTFEETLEHNKLYQPPSFKEIRSGKAAAAARVPTKEVRIPANDINAAQLSLPVSSAIGDLNPLVKRVRDRTAARLKNSGRS